jgi:spore maturation protein SpmA
MWLKFQPGGQMLSPSVVVVALVVVTVVVLVSVVVEVSVACAVNKTPLIIAATATTDSSVKAVTFLFMWFHLPEISVNGGLLNDFSELAPILTQLTPDLGRTNLLR